MSTALKLDFAPLDASGKNYMEWILEVKMYLKSEAILETIQDNYENTEVDKAKACRFIRRHLDNALKFEYLTIEDPLILWNNLKERFDNQKEVLLPSVREEWRSIRFQDFKRVNDYSSALLKICSQLKFCGQNITDADMIEKTFTTFHKSSITLQQQLRLMNFTRYADLNTYLLIAEQNNELLIKNHQSRPTGSIAFPEVNAINHDRNDHIHEREKGRGQGNSRNNSHNRNFNRGHPYNRGGYRGGFRGRGRGRGRGYETRPNYNPQNNEKTPNHGGKASTSQNRNDPCFRCGANGHWSKNCRTPRHLVELYQKSINDKGKEVNLTDDVEFQNVELNAADFCNEVET